MFLYLFSHICGTQNSRTISKPSLPSEISTAPRASKDVKAKYTGYPDTAAPQHNLFSLSPSLLRPFSPQENQYSLFRQREDVAQSSEVVVEALERVSNEGQAEFWALLLLRRGSGTPSGLLSLEQRGVIRLVNLVRREVCGIDGGCKTGFEGRTDAAQAVELNAAEEGVALDFVRTTTAETVLSVADEAMTSQYGERVISGEVKSMHTF